MHVNFKKIFSVSLILTVIVFLKVSAAVAETVISVKIAINKPVRVSINFPKPVWDIEFPRWIYGYYKTFPEINHMRTVAQSPESIIYEIDFNERIPSIVAGSGTGRDYLILSQSTFPNMSDPALYPVRFSFDLDKGLPLISNYPVSSGKEIVFQTAKEFLDSFFCTGAYYSYEISEKGHKILLWFNEKLSDETVVINKIRAIVRYQINLFNGDFESDYSFVFNAVKDKKDGYQGLEYKNAAVINIPSGEMSDPSGMLYGLVAHEFFHRWNIKRMAPLGYIVQDYNETPSTREVWFFEGVTKYYEIKSLYKTGIVSKEEFLDSMSQILRKSMMEVRGKPFLATSENVFQTGRNYYDELVTGAAVAFLADIRMIAATGGNKSFDDVLMFMNVKYGKTGLPYTHEDIMSAINEVSGIDISQWFEINSTALGMEHINETVSLAGLDFNYEKNAVSYITSAGEGSVFKRASAKLALRMKTGKAEQEVRSWYFDFKGRHNG